jgi:hypothetical protein
MKDFCKSYTHRPKMRRPSPGHAARRICLKDRAAAQNQKDRAAAQNHMLAEDR